LEKDFEALITGYLQTNIGISEHFLSDVLLQNLKNNLLELYHQNCFISAGIGNNKKLNHDVEVRSDSVYWLDRKHENVHENDFLTRIEEFICYLNKSCFAGITGYEFHYSLYEIGSFYKKHVDQFQDNSSRKYSMITYLNPDWQDGDGGHLKIHQVEGNQQISPTLGKTVFFKSSELLHEVQITYAQRLSITGWLRRD
jgi:Rps23 Pro-64 3,4-dihydroxylase Tpa1-like proline 4-hydroxylase